MLDRYLKRKAEFKKTHASFMSNTKWLKLFELFDDLKNSMPAFPKWGVSYSTIFDYFDNQKKPYLRNPRFELPSVSDIYVSDDHCSFKDGQSLGSGGPLELDDLWLLALPYEQLIQKSYGSGVVHQDSPTLVFPDYQHFLSEVDHIGKFPYRIDSEYYVFEASKESSRQLMYLYKFIVFAGYEY